MKKLLFSSVSIILCILTIEQVSESFNYLPLSGYASGGMYPEKTEQLRKSALVIGNGNYRSSVLSNPENDARALEYVLKKLGFVVYKYENLNQNQMKKVIDDFGLNLKGFYFTLFYYAGHGIQSNGYNYLIPVDAQLISEKQVEYDCVQADRILAIMEGSGTETIIIILDACRNNPFERSWTRSSAGKGLAFMNAPSGTLIAYSTSPGNTAQDGSGNNSPYTSAILECILIPDISITQMFQNVTRIVSGKSSKQQIPWISSSLTGDFYFNPSGIVEDTIQNYVQANIKNGIPSEIRQVTDISERMGSFVDPRDNLQYKTIRIGNQIWMAENLKATKYADGKPIELVTTVRKWDDLKITDKTYCYYNDDVNNGNIYGALYTWAAAMNGAVSSIANPSGVQGVCPTGWHLPSDAEWTVLATYLGEDVAGDKLKETGITHWRDPNTYATNESGFTALPGGCRYDNGDYHSTIKNDGLWWSSTEGSQRYAHFWQVQYWDRSISTSDNDKSYGFSVRCIQNNSPGK